jgi:Ca-activated chloride channel family protein
MGRALVCGAVGLGIGFGGGLLAILPAGFLFNMMTMAAVSLMDKPPQPGQRIMFTGFAFLVFMMGRAAAWAAASVPAGLGQGIALKEKKVILNGLVGGTLGGLLGGLLFDPIDAVFTTADGQAAASRAVGFVMIGLMVGLFVGLVEGWTKTAWLMMRAGPLAGKQFVLYRDTTVVGSSPKAEVYLFKDDAIEPRHALIYNRGGRFEIEDCNTPDGTYVNGIPVKRQVLQNGDQIVLGKTVLEFSIKESR